MNELALFNKPLKIDTKISPIESQNRAIKYYQTYLDMTDNSHRKIDAIRRLADLKLEKYEERIAVNQDAETSPYQAIKHYESLIKNNPDYEHIDSALYQLARAYDLSGELIKSLQILLKLIENQPDSPYTAEAYFRLGDTLFTLERYQEAAHAYQKIIQKGQLPYFMKKHSTSMVGVSLNGGNTNRHKNRSSNFLTSYYLIRTPHYCGPLHHLKRMQTESWSMIFSRY